MYIVNRLKLPKNLISRMLCWATIVCFSLANLSILILPAFGQSALSNPLPGVFLPAVGAMVEPTVAFEPAVLKGIKVFADNPLRFDFIIDPGDTDLNGQDLEDETKRLVDYFLASVTVPGKDIWVNLSPYEGDRVAPDSFARTEMGRDMLAEDYILKQLTASLMYPKKELGQKFWDKIYKRALDEFGTTEIPVNTFHKVWIVPQKAVVYENGDTAFVVESRLKVMLEDDYLAANYDSDTDKVDRLLDADKAMKMQTEIIRDILIPEIEREVNFGKNFMQLRQIYNSVILGYWFKNHVRQTLLSDLYVGANKVDGIDLVDKNAKEIIYAQYLEAFKKGVYNFIHEDVKQSTGETIPRKYFSGGTNLDLDKAGNNVFETIYRINSNEPIEGNDLVASVRLDVVGREGKSVSSSSPIIVGPDSKSEILQNTLSRYQGKINQLLDEQRKIPGWFSNQETYGFMETALVRAYHGLLQETVEYLNARDNDSSIFVYPFAGPDLVPNTLSKTIRINNDVNDVGRGENILLRVFGKDNDDFIRLKKEQIKDIKSDALEEESYADVAVSGQRKIFLIKNAYMFFRANQKAMAANWFKHILNDVLKKGDKVLFLSSKDVALFEPMAKDSGFMQIGARNDKVYPGKEEFVEDSLKVLIIPDAFVLMEKQGGASSPVDRSPGSSNGMLNHADLRKRQLYQLAAKTIYSDRRDGDLNEIMESVLAEAGSLSVSNGQLDEFKQIIDLRTARGRFFVSAFDHFWKTGSALDQDIIRVFLTTVFKSTEGLQDTLHILEHSMTVALYHEYLGGLVGLDEEEINLGVSAGLLHDLGKMQSRETIRLHNSDRWLNEMDMEERILTLDHEEEPALMMAQYGIRIPEEIIDLIRHSNAKAVNGKPESLNIATLFMADQFAGRFDWFRNYRWRMAKEYGLADIDLSLKSLMEDIREEIPHDGAFDLNGHLDRLYNVLGEEIKGNGPIIRGLAASSFEEFQRRKKEAGSISSSPVSRNSVEAPERMSLRLYSDLSHKERMKVLATVAGWTRVTDEGKEKPIFFNSDGSIQWTGREVSNNALLAFVDHKPVAVMGFLVPSETLGLVLERGIYVAQEFRGNEIGPNLVVALLDYLKQKGYKKLNMVFDSNIEPQRLAQKIMNRLNGELVSDEIWPNEDGGIRTFDINVNKHTITDFYEKGIPVGKTGGPPSAAGQLSKEQLAQLVSLPKEVSIRLAIMPYLLDQKPKDSALIQQRSDFEEDSSYLLVNGRPHPFQKAAISHDAQHMAIDMVSHSYVLDLVAVQALLNKGDLRLQRNEELRLVEESVAYAMNEYIVIEQLKGVGQAETDFVSQKAIEVLQKFGWDKKQFDRAVLLTKQINSEKRGKGYFSFRHPIKTGFDELTRQPSAVLGATNNDKLGGIDLTEGRFDIQSTGPGIGDVAPIDESVLKQLLTEPVNGFVPVIIQIAPAINMPLLLGENKIGGQTPLALMDDQ